MYEKFRESPLRSLSELVGWTKWSRLVGDIIKISLIAVVLLLPIKYFVAQPFVVEGGSMVPTLMPKDYVIIDELSYMFNEPIRGDLVVFKYPLDPSLYFIKRVVGLPGDVLSIQNGVVTLRAGGTGEPTQVYEPYAQSYDAADDDMSITLGPTEYFMLGDNRGASFDSRVWGPVPARNIIGRAYVRVLPFARAGFLKN